MESGDGKAGNRKRIAVACQGGGIHTAFTAGSLKELLVQGYEKHGFVVFSGRSWGQRS